MTRRTAVALHVAVIGLIYCFSPVATSGDSRWTVPVALNILQHGSTTLEPYAAQAISRPDRSWERAPNGRLYAKYPAAVSVISLPFLLPLEIVPPVARAIFHPHFASPILTAFFRGDFVGAYGLVEMLEASCLMALAAGVQLLIGLEFLPLPLASLLTFLFAFATPVWSTASRAMWNHTPALLMLSVAVYLLILARREERYAAYASIPLELAFMMRPTMAIAAAVLTAFVATHHRRWLGRYILTGIPLAVMFFAYNLYTRGHWFQSYFTDAGAWPAAPWAERFGLQLVSPSRGLFVFCPVVAFSFAGIWLAMRKGWLFPLSPWLAGLIFAQVLLVTKYYWPGFCYGPRYFTEVLPLFTLFLIPVMQVLPTGALWWRALFVVAVAWSVFVEARGATAFVVHQWNGSPVSVDVDMARVWDWSDPPFLRGLH